VMGWLASDATALTGPGLTPPPSGLTTYLAVRRIYVGSGKFFLELGKFWN
jgi:hypothetical protein